MMKKPMPDMFEELPVPCTPECFPDVQLFNAVNLSARSLPEKTTFDRIFQNLNNLDLLFRADASVAAKNVSVPVLPVNFFRADSSQDIHARAFNESKCT